VIEILLQAERALEMGRVDAAETLYQQVADADPRNSIAVVGLARVTLERGDEAGALAIARRALTIDPENAAAARMAERLEEVIRYRGQEPPAPMDEAVKPAPMAAEPDVIAERAVVAATSMTPPASPLGPPKRRSFLDRLLRRNAS
jgi:thioredoxin-like negative regulator of GroEL